VCVFCSNPYRPPKTLAENLGVSERTVTKRLGELRKAGIIEALDTREVAHLRRQGYDVPGPGRGSVWRIRYDKLPDFQLSEEAGFHPEEKGASTQGGRILQPPLESRKGNGPRQHQESNEPATNTGDEVNGGGGEVSAPPSPEPEIQNLLEQNLLEWKVSKPQAQRLASLVDADLIHQALNLLERNQALPRDKRIIRNPGGWIYYSLMILDDPALPEWERRIAAAEEDIRAPEPTTYVVTLPELAPPPPPAVIGAPDETEESVEDLESPEEIAAAIEQSFAEAEGQAAPSFDVACGTEKEPGTVASIEAGKKQMALNYGRSPEAPEGDIISDERTMPNPGPSPPSSSC